MPNFDMKNNSVVVSSLHSASRTAAATGDAVDLQGIHSAMVVVAAGAISGTNPAFTFTVMERDDPADDWVAVAAADLEGAIPVIGDDEEEAAYSVGYKGNKRYIAARLDDVGGTATPTLHCSAVVVGGRLGSAPPAA